MTNQIEVLVPNIGDSGDVDVIEVLVQVGDSISEGDALITLESDKASMEVPSEQTGVVKQLAIKVGDKVTEGSVILTLETTENVPADVPDNTKVETVEEPVVAEPKSSSKSKQAETLQQVNVPDIGDAIDVDVIEVMVQSGDNISKDQSLITLEGDKATMDIPSPYSGIVEAVNVSVGDKVSQGYLILTVKVSESDSSVSEVAEAPAQAQAEEKPKQPASSPADSIKPKETAQGKSPQRSKKVYASPSIRRLARELGVDLTLVEGSGRKGRITKEDVQKFIKARLAEPQGNVGLPKVPDIDFSKFGSIEFKPLNKIKRLTAQNMQRAWLNVPHVTQFDEADITELEAFRQANKERVAKQGTKLTPLAFIVQAVVKALQAFPHFNASIDGSGENLVLKQYYNVGIAVDTPNGLVVPVIKNADQKGIVELAKSMAELSEKARNKALTPADMSGGSFTISSLGGIGGTAFTPIVNAPEVAILGVSRSQMKPQYDGKAFQPRLMLPLSLSYDHRVIDGAEAARFSNYLCQCLSDIRTMLL